MTKAAICHVMASQDGAVPRRLRLATRFQDPILPGPSAFDHKWQFLRNPDWSRMFQVATGNLERGESRGSRSPP